MKKMKMLLLTAVLIIISCGTEDTNSSNDIESKADITFNSLTNSDIGIDIDGKFEFEVSNEKILQTFKKSNEDLGLEPLYFDVISLENKKYLRFYCKNDFVSTIAIVKDNENGKYRTGTTECISKACSSGGGCVPDGLYCTKCTPPDTQPGGPAGDCLRKTSGNQ